ncbi:IFNGR2 isoform 2 [Pongo abelii]|uniref:IFNGR2 isoform 2 n=1 Tax=Pongo abelii TaxID=9601 RepID=A0A2J8UKZ1_PONAB|nr:IFNGR2 isoform 2 [Pongo abelii]
MRPTLLWSPLLLLGVFAAAAPPAQLTLETYQEWRNDSAAIHEMGDSEQACGGQNNGPQRCPRPHPQSL